MRTSMKLATLLGFLLLGCGHRHRAPLNIVVLIDISASIDGGSGRMESAADAVANKLVGGDEISVISICDGSYSASHTSPLHFRVSEKREAFDEEVARFRSQFRRQVQAMLSATPCKKTAILDAIERSTSLGQRTNYLYIFTDGIEDADISFYKDQQLRSARDAAKLADKLALVYRHMPDTKVRLGLIESEDFDKLPRERSEAVVAFWKTYLAALSKDSQIEAPELLRD